MFSLCVLFYFPLLLVDPTCVLQLPTCAATKGNSKASVLIICCDDSNREKCMLRRQQLSVNMCVRVVLSEMLESRLFLLSRSLCGNLYSMLLRISSLVAHYAEKNWNVVFSENCILSFVASVVFGCALFSLSLLI